MNRAIKTSINFSLALCLALFLAACSTDKAETAETAASTESCVLDPPAQPVACTMQYDPVCGCDGKTYGNACMAGGAGVPQWVPGACEGQEEPR